MFEWGLFDHRDRWSWFWIIAVGELILRPFGLYDATYDHSVDDPEPTKSFAPSEAWLTKNVLPNNPQLHAADFHLMRTGRAPLVVNTNIIEDKAVELPVQIPVQVEADWAGARGRSVDGTIGGGLVQSLGFTSTFASGAGPGRANVAVDRRYSLADIAGCSSAFFASEILHYLGVAIDDVVDELHKVGIPTSITDRLRTRLDDLLDADAEAIIPTYDYWQPQGAGSTPTTTSRGFSDGGDFDNTGVLGAIARTGATRLVVMLNSENGLEALPDKTTATVPGMLALLFGYRDERCKDGQPDPSGTWTKYGPRSPHEPLSYVQVFSDDEGEFADVQAQLLKNSSAGGSETGAATAWARQTLTTKQNDVAGIRGGRTVEVLWILNQKVHAWQDRITDPGLKDDLAAGQDHQDGPLKNFPLYNTGGQIDLSPEAVNMLAQLSAWNVQQLHDELGDLLG